MDMVTARVLLVFVSFRFKFKVLCTYSVFILSATRKKKKKFPRSPNGLLIKTTGKETPSRVTPIHLPHTDARPQAQRPPHSRSASGRELGPWARGRTVRRGGAGLRPAARGPGATVARRQPRGRDSGLPPVGTRVSRCPGNVAAYPQPAEF